MGAIFFQESQVTHSMGNNHNQSNHHHHVGGLHRVGHLLQRPPADVAACAHGDPNERALSRTKFLF